MTTPPTFDQQVSGWLEDGPVDAPDGTLETILVAFPSLPQRRAAWRAPWRTSSMSGLVRALAAIAAVVVIIAAALIVLPRLQPGNVGGLPSPIPATPSLSPTLTPTPSASPMAKPSPTVKPSPSPSASVAVTSPACLGGDLAARVMDWQGAAGTRFGTLRLQNVGTSSCLISGTPGIQLVDSQGQVFLDSANLGNPASASPAKPVFTLRAGGASSIYLMAGLTNYCGADPAAPVRLALVLPASLGRLVATAPAGVEITMAPCNGSTVSTELHVQVPWSTRAP
jgi:Protein of unknown function (DUF4232)